jgi:hypothetical protein
MLLAGILLLLTGKKDPEEQGPKGGGADPRQTL